MICRHCGFQNAPGDEFCGNCGKYLEWDSGAGAGQAGNEGVSDETQVTPLPPPPAAAPPPPPTAPPPPPTTPPPAYPPPPPPGPPQMARPAQAPIYGAVVCWNCGQNNPPNRAFCQNCGERLSVGSLPSERAAMARPESGGGNRMGLIVGIGLVGVVLLAAIGAAIFLGGGPGPTASPTPGAEVSPSGEPSPTLATESPTDQASQPPSLPPTTPPVTEPPTAPPPTPANCATSTVPTAWVNLDGANTRARVRRGEAWCIHQVFVVPDPNFGIGRIRLRVNGETLEPVDVRHEATSTETEYPFVFPTPVLVPPRSDVTYSMNCGGGLCNAVIQVGYQLIPAP